jgi:O-methyltransferase
MSFSRTIRSIVKDASLKTGIYNQLFFNVYPYMYEPNELILLAEYIKSVRDVPGCLVEAGVAYGATTVFLNKFIHAEGIEREYYAIDTFSGFLDEHTEYEITNRSKPVSIGDSFKENKKAWFDRSMILHDIKRVKSVECDVTIFDFSAIKPIAFCRQARP